MSKNQNENLLPCPFCNSRKVIAWESRPLVHQILWCVFCETCEGEGPHAETKQEAIAGWNKRDGNHDLSDFVKTAEEMLDCHNEENPLLGITASIALLKAQKSEPSELAGWFQSNVAGEVID